MAAFWKEHEGEFRDFGLTIRAFIHNLLHNHTISYDELRMATDYECSTLHIVYDECYVEPIFLAVPCRFILVDHGSAQAECVSAATCFRCANATSSSWPTTHGHSAWSTKDATVRLQLPWSPGAEGALWDREIAEISQNKAEEVSSIRFDPEFYRPCSPSQRERSNHATNHVKHPPGARR